MMAADPCPFSCWLYKPVCPSAGGPPCQDFPPSETVVDRTHRPGAKSRSSLLLGPGGPQVHGAPGGGQTVEPLRTEDGAEGLGPSQADDELSGLDLSWMQERVGHLGAAFTAAAAHLGPGNQEAAVPSSSFPSQGGAESLEAPPTVLLTGSSHEMAAFAGSVGMATAAVAPPPAPPATPRSFPPKEPLVCAACGRLFPSDAALELHQRSHAGERPYSCPHCGKGFAQPNNLWVHLLIHTGERRYRCSLCGKSFLSSSHLKRHRTVHTQEKPYSCSRCGQSFSQMCSVRRHRQQSQCGL